MKTLRSLVATAALGLAALCLVGATPGSSEAQVFRWGSGYYGGYGAYAYPHYWSGYRTYSPYSYWGGYGNYGRGFGYGRNFNYYRGLGYYGYPGYGYYGNYYW